MCSELRSDVHELNLEGSKGTWKIKKKRKKKKQFPGATTGNTHTVIWHGCVSTCIKEALSVTAEGSPKQARSELKP